MARVITRVSSTPAPQPGFIGEGHLAVEVLRPDELTDSDPFALLMDDRLDIARRRQIGGPHPHAGLETVTLVLEGSAFDRDEGAVSAGDALWMTAGRGVVHNEHVEAEGKVRILQLWIGLPARARFAAPSLQRLPAGEQPVLNEPGVMVRLYSGQSGALVSPTKNLVPVTLAEIKLGPDAQHAFALPAAHTGFLYVIEGELKVGANSKRVRAGEVGWLDPAAPAGSSELPLSAGAAGARAVLYAGEPHGEALIQHGPFVADSEKTIMQFYSEYRAGRFQRLSELAASRPLANASSLPTNP
jgi:redox-sensitive bicupin YhaK (pirin superfamily)